jgi:hypothetical protein
MKNLFIRTWVSQSVEPLSDIPVMTKMILCRGKTSAKAGVNLLIEKHGRSCPLPEFTRSTARSLVFKGVAKRHGSG